MSAPISDEELAAIRARLRAATPGPWFTDRDEHPNAVRSADRNVCGLHDGGQTRADVTANARFIANAPVDVARLALELEETRRTKASDDGAYEHVCTMYHAAVEDLRIANERGDAWRQQVKEDTVALEELQSRLGEVEKERDALRDGLRELAEAWERIGERNKSLVWFSRARELRYLLDASAPVAAVSETEESEPRA